MVTGEPYTEDKRPNHQPFYYIIYYIYILIPISYWRV
jgi:hypothetical protein